MRKSRRLWLCIVFGFMLFFAIPVHGEEDAIRVIVDGVNITEDTILGAYTKETKIEVQVHDIENISNVEIYILQEGKKLEFLKSEKMDKITTSITVPIGEGYTFQIHAEVNGSKKQWNFLHPFQIVEEVPIYVQDRVLDDYHVLQQNEVLKYSSQEFLQNDKSYILVNETRKDWEKTDNGYEYKIEETGIFEVEFHFFTINNIEFIQKNKIVKEDVNIASKLYMNGLEQHQNQLFYKDDVQVLFETKVLDSQNLILYINNEKKDVTWILKDTLYQARLNFDKENYYFIRLVYQNKDIQIPLKEIELTVDKTPPNVYMNVHSKEIYNDKIVLDVTVDDPLFSFESFILDKSQEDKMYQSWKKTDNGYSMQLILEEEGVHQLQFQCFDRANNSANIYQNGDLLTQDAVFIIDKTPPQITSNMNELSFHHNQKQTIRFAIKDEHIAKEDIELSVYRNQKKYEVSATFKEVASQLLLEFSLEEDGEYEVQVKATDIAGNENVYPVKKILLDQKKPEVSLFVDKRITNQDVSIQVRAFDEKYELYKITTTRDGEVIKEEQFFENLNKIIKFHEDNGTHQYEIVLYAKDQVGNEAITSTTFIIDKQAPLIQSLYQRQPYHQKIITNKSFEIDVMWNDLNLDKADILMYKNGELMEQRTLEETYFKKRISALAFRKDEFQYVIRAYDKAGNIGEEQLTIMLNTEIPQLEVIDEFQGKPKNAAWLPVLKNIQDDMAIKEVALVRNYEEIAYTWGTPISEDGIYQLTLTSQDTAGNIAKLKPFYFEIDKTAPSIQIVNSTTHQEILQPYEGNPIHITIDSGFLNKDKIHSILLNDKEQLTEDVLQYDMKLSEGNYHFVITALDDAGNKTEKIIDFHINKEEIPWSFYIMLGIPILFIIYKLIKGRRCWL